MSTHQVRNSKTTSHRQTTHGPTAEGRKWFKLETDIQYILINISMRTNRHQCRVETWRPLVLRFSISDTWSIGYLPTLLKPHLAFCIIGVWNHWLWARQQRSTPRQHWTCHPHEWDRQIAATSTANSNHRIQYNLTRSGKSPWNTIVSIILHTNASAPVDIGAIYRKGKSGKGKGRGGLRPKRGSIFLVEQQQLELDAFQPKPGDPAQDKLWPEEWSPEGNWMNMDEQLQKHAVRPGSENATFRYRTVKTWRHSTNCA